TSSVNYISKWVGAFPITIRFRLQLAIINFFFAAKAIHNFKTIDGLVNKFTIGFYTVINKSVPTHSTATLNGRSQLLTFINNKHRKTSIGYFSGYRASGRTGTNY